MKRIVIVGATSGIGLEVAKLCIQAGWQIGAAGRREEALEKLRTQAPDLIVTESLDITRDDAPEHLSRLIDKLGGMDIYLHCSGIGKRNTELHPDIEIDTLRTNGEGFVRMVTAAFGYFRAHGGGHLAVISSIAGTKEHLHRRTGAVGAYGETEYPLYGHPPRIRRHAPAGRRRALSDADAGREGRRTDYEGPEAAAPPRGDRPPLCGHGILLEDDSRMALGTAQHPQERLTAKHP